MVQDIFIAPEKPDSSGASSSKAVNQIRGQTRSDSEASSIHMEVDETSQCTEKGGNTDIDSGIENMEVKKVCIVQFFFVFYFYTNNY